MVRQFKGCFATFGIALFIRCDNGPPSSEWPWRLSTKSTSLTCISPPPATLRVQGLLKEGVALVKKTKEEALAAFESTRSKNGFSQDHLFFVRNWQNPSLPNLITEPVVEEMVEARNRVRAGGMVKTVWRAKKVGQSCTEATRSDDASLKQRIGA